MTAIRNTQTGEWIHPAPRSRSVAPQYIRVTASRPRNVYRGEHVINIAHITKIERCAAGYWLYVAGSNEPLLIFREEYEQLIDALESSGQLLTLREGEV